MLRGQGRGQWEARFLQPGGLHVSLLFLHLFQKDPRTPRSSWYLVEPSDGEAPLPPNRLTHVQHIENLELKLQDVLRKPHRLENDVPLGHLLDLRSSCSFAEVSAAARWLSNFRLTIFQYFSLHPLTYDFIQCARPLSVSSLCSLYFLFGSRALGRCRSYASRDSHDHERLSCLEACAAKSVSYSWIAATDEPFEPFRILGWSLFFSKILNRRGQDPCQSR